MDICIQGPAGVRLVGPNQPVFVIAEIGKNFIQTEEERSVTEYLQNALALVQAAKEAGADAVKFQTHFVDDEQADIDVVSPHFHGSDRYRWVSRNTRMTPFESFWKPLKQACDDLGIIFFSTPMSRGAAQALETINPSLWKVGSGDLLDFVALDFLRQTGKPIFISSGMSTLEEVDQAISFLQEKNQNIVLLHCVSRYPCPPEALHLRTISFYHQRYQVPIGFSDHSTTIDSAIAAAALGACVIEKHFSFNRQFWGSDHKVSLLPTELAALVAGVRHACEDLAYREAVVQQEQVQRGLGTEAKILDDQEAVFRPIFRKTLVASQDLPGGTRLEPGHLYAMRPQAHLIGLPSEAYPRVLGQCLKRNLRKYEPLQEVDVEFGFYLDKKRFYV